MSYFSRAGVPPNFVEDRSPTPAALETFARVEGLIGEEAALLSTRPEDRGEKVEQRLQAIAAELDRIWERLRERAERLGRGGGEPASAAT